MKSYNLTKLGLFLAISLFSANGYSQTVHRYVLEVETTRPVTVEAKGNIHGTYTINIEEPRKTIEYYEVLSETPLTIYQCNDSIRLGRARKIKDPYATQEMEYKEIIFNGTTREVIVDGEVKGTW